jgi:serine phosphatase RsbU (regulator of sigma subunit)
MNSALLGNTQNQFVTAAYVHLKSETGKLRYSAAAHPPPLLVKNGHVIQVEENGLMLAAFYFASDSTAAHKLEPGDRVVMYTDGILEGSNRDNPHIAVEHVLVIVVLRLDHFVAHLESPAEPLDAWLAGTNWVVEFAHTQRSPVHRAKHLNIADRIRRKPRD